MKSNFFPLVSLGNEDQISKDSASLAAGIIALANESRFNASHYSEALTQYTVGYKDPEDLLSAVEHRATDFGLAQVRVQNARRRQSVFHD